MTNRQGGSSKNPAGKTPPHLIEAHEVSRQLEEVKLQIASAVELRPDIYQHQDVTLVAVSKRQPDNKIDAALATGHRIFGENHIQEARLRWARRRKLYTDLNLHLIGSLQTNKVAEAVALFDVIEVVDRAKLARELSKEMAKQNRHLPCYIQVNTGEEPQKSGIMPDKLSDLVELCRGELGLSVTGLMCIPPINEEAVMHFALLNTMAKRLGLPHLSMGMSGDYKDAIGFGATSVRIGSAIFGERIN